MNAQRLKVLIVSSERNLLRELSWLLDDFGYQPIAVSDPSKAAEFARIVAPQMVVLDGRETAAALDLLSDIVSARETDELTTLLVHDSQSEFDVLEAMEVGVDDFLEFPINRAETLSRLRTAARSVELERQLSQLGVLDEPADLAAVAGQAQRARKLSDSSGAPATSVSCLAVEIDFFADLERYFGEATVEQLVGDLSSELSERARRGAISAVVGRGRITVCIPNDTGDQAKGCVAEIRNYLADRKYDVGERKIGLTASCGLAVWRPGAEMEETLRASYAALAGAIQSGGNCLHEAGQIDNARNTWKTCLRDGNPFVGAKARDVMIPFTRWLPATRTVADAAAAFEETQLPILPVYEDESTFLGIVRREDALSQHAFGGANESIQGLLTSDYVPLVDDSAFEVVMEYFFSDHETPIVLFRDDLPRGYLTCNSFASLVATVDSSTFAPTECPAQDAIPTVPDIERDGVIDIPLNQTAAQRSGLPDKISPSRAAR